MDSLLSSNRETFTHTLRISSPISLLKQALYYLRQGRHFEGLSLCAQAREGLSPAQMQFAAVIDAFLESYDHYKQAQQAFHQASRYFVEAENEQQAQLLIFEKLLSDSNEALEEIISTSSRPYDLVRAPDDYQEPRALNPTQPLAVSFKSNRSPQPLQPALNDDVDHNTLPALYITCFGHFEVNRLGQPITLCQNRNGQAILRYLLAQPGYQATIDSLMDILWPDDEAEVARHKVQVAVSALRCSLNKGYTSDPGGGYIHFKNGIYQPNPASSIYTDVDRFLLCYQTGRQRGGDEAIFHYERACRLYTGPFLTEDMYADWTYVRREQLSQKFQTMCHALVEYYLTIGRYEDAEQWASAILAENRCDEEAHRQLMQAYVARGHRSEALRQFQHCVDILRELGATPMPETISLFQSILLCQNTLPLRNANRAQMEHK